MAVSINTDTWFSMEGRKVLIQSPGHPYGEAMVKGFLAAGANVWLCGAGADTCLSIEVNGNKPAGAFPQAPRGEEEASKLVEDARAAMGSLDAFVHVSPPPMLPGWKHSYEAIDEALKVSQQDLMLAVKHIGSWMVEQGKGSLIFVTDYAALVGSDMENCGDDRDCMDRDFALDYGFVKSSYVNYARQAAGYLGTRNVRCNAIACGPMDSQVSDQFGANYVRHSHLKRLAREEDLMAAALFLASDASGYITGATLPVDGGYTAK